MPARLNQVRAGSGRNARQIEEWADRWRQRGVWLDELLGTALQNASRPFGSDLAIVDRNTRLTFAQLDRITESVTCSLASMGLGQGDVIALQLPTWWEAIAISHASFRLGSTLLPIGPNLGTNDLDVIFDLVAPSVLFLPEEFRGIRWTERLGDVRLDKTRVLTVRAQESTVVGSSFESLLDAKASAQSVAKSSCGGSPDDVAVLLFTSGSTAAPKGVLHSHNSLCAESYSLRATHSLGAEDVILMPYPINHVGGFSYGVLVPFVSGATVVLMDRWDPAMARELIQKENISFLSAVPSVVRSLIDQVKPNQYRASTLQTIALGGTRVTSQEVAFAAEAFGCAIKRGYGLTEMPTFSSTYAMLNGDDEEARTDGRPAGESLVLIVDEDGNECPRGVVGEIQIQGPELFVGYLQSELNEGAFTRNGYFRTGDLGCLDSRGRLRVSGRLKDVIIRNGENISPAELEALILLHPSVLDVAVIGVPDDIVGERVCAVMEVVKSEPLALADVCEFLLERGVAKFKLPEAVAIWDALPKTANEKIDKRAIRANLTAQ